MRHGLVDLVFKVHRGFEAEGAVEPLPVVKDFDPLEDGGAGFGPRVESAAMDEFAFEAAPKTELAINLPEETITLLATGGKESFMINGYKKHNMLNGFDDIDYLQAMKEEINSFAAARSI